MPNSYEHSYQHDLDNVIDASDAVLAIGTEKVDTNTLKDRSLNGNDATIHGAMPSIGYFLGRRFTAVNGNYLDCGNDSSFDIIGGTFCALVLSSDVFQPHRIMHKNGAYSMYISGSYPSLYNYSSATGFASTIPISSLKLNFICVLKNSNGITFYVNGIKDGEFTTAQAKQDFSVTADNLYIGIDEDLSTSKLDGILPIGFLYNTDTNIDIPSFFNTLARLPLYSHNFTQYPNSDTSLTAVFQYTSGIITSGSFNKTDGLKCTSAGTIVFSNNFEFDGREYLTLTIDGVEYSGTTTVTHGTITATIAQGSNDITIEMGTNDVLEDIHIQFRSEV